MAKHMTNSNPYKDVITIFNQHGTSIVQFMMAMVIIVGMCAGIGYYFHMAPQIGQASHHFALENNWESIHIYQKRLFGASIETTEVTQGGKKLDFGEAYPGMHPIMEITDDGELLYAADGNNFINLMTSWDDGRITVDPTPEKSIFRIGVDADMDGSIQGKEANIISLTLTLEQRDHKDKVLRSVTFYGEAIPRN
jgi:hypothetical protein